ncbi:MAG: PspC domain-containing protein [Bacteroidetes bacterium]|nr:PspC domain-containing protein [Bacteroidota bacterium]
MKKTVSANISGIIFNMDEDAYEKFHNYLSAVRGHFSASEGRDEIMADIEARVAEMFQQRVGDRKQVVTLKDVEEVITQMGKPEDFAGDGAGAGASAEEAAAGTGSGRKYRRLYRDSDDRVLGGVCSGIAHYFGFDPLWLRLAFAVALFFFGTGVLLYILLWIIVPQARTAAEKLEMKGEKVNISNISKSIEEEMDYLKKKLNDLKDDAKNIKTKPIVDKAENIFSRFFSFLGELFTALMKGFLRFIGFILLAIGIIFLIWIIIAAVGGYTITTIAEGDFSAIPFPGILNYFFDSPFQVTLLKGGLLLLIGIPVFMFIYEGIKLLFRVKTKTHIIGFTAFALWIAGWMICAIVAAGMVKDYSVKSVVKKEIPLLQPAGSTIYLSVKNDGLGGDEDEDTNQISIKINNHRLLYRNDGKVYLGYVQLDVQKSENDSFKLVIRKISRGETRKEAQQRADEVQYNFSQSDSAITFSPYFTIGEKSKWRAQQLKLTLKVPPGKSIYLDGSMEEIIYDIENVTNTVDEEMPGKKWIMTEKGLESEE